MHLCRPACPLFLFPNSFCTFHFIIPFFKNTVQNNFKYLKKEKLSVIEMQENIFKIFCKNYIFTVQMQDFVL